MAGNNEMSRIIKYLNILSIDIVEKKSRNIEKYETITMMILHPPHETSNKKPDIAHIIVYQVIYPPENWTV